MLLIWAVDLQLLESFPLHFFFLILFPMKFWENSPKTEGGRVICDLPVGIDEGSHLPGMS